MTACSSKPIYVQQPFMGFREYEVPPKVNVVVERNCKASYMLGDYRTKVDVGDCVRVKDVTNLVRKVKILEGIVDNYKQDIATYNKLNRR